ncbi:NADH-quinone oxidoreductase subunit NuoK [Thermaerobacter composti]|uniref:NADH-quinone oxidoreductase subunit K n=1 Tax=Thermaerobacter composti TaxID=554949 RepID=A0ABZ0QRW0_9FIRM|nr:NADH-quinone oxidoreductase subunit NuoK [Thermaerobacter composti]PZN09033.1 MAG: NADH-quinone oxidoreductase subunit NuoK [Bacillota bacterium]WPD20215.1 NADH-quinone oxidoreductase subunit NuoK [Thermaerobacter composti]
MGGVPLLDYLVVGTLLFGLGLWGALTRTNAIRILMCIELMLNAVNLNLVALNRYLDPGSVEGQIFGLFIIAIAAAEAAIGIGIVLMVVRRRGEVDINKIRLMRG